MYFLQTPQHKEFAGCCFHSKKNGLREFKNNLELFYNNTEEIKQNKEDQKKKDLIERRFVINTASKLYNKLLNIYAIQYDKFSIAQKKRINVLNKPENVKS